MSQSILIERQGNIGIITLNRPEVMNAWNKPMRDQLVAALNAMNADESVRAIILTGAGDKAFGAGQDLNETKTFDADRAGEWMQEWKDLYNALRYLTKPSIAALNGVAAGSAFQFALLCDIRIGHPGVRMGQPEIKSGVASVTGPWIMEMMIGLARAIDLTLTGRLIDAEEAHQIGLLQRIVPQDQVMAAAIALATDLGAQPPVAMQLTKQRFREATDAGFEAAIEAGIRIQIDSYKTGEPARMMEAFLTSRKAR